MVAEALEVRATTMYLGRSLWLLQAHEMEMEHRIKKPWPAFGVYKVELLHQAVPLKLRLHLFHGIVTQAIVYGCTSCVLTAERVQKLYTSKREGGEGFKST